MKSFALWFIKTPHQIKQYRLYSTAKESDVKQRLFSRFKKILNNRFTAAIISQRQ
jgi:hypothetical protein